MFYGDDKDQENEDWNKKKSINQSIMKSMCKSMIMMSHDNIYLPFAKLCLCVHFENFHIQLLYKSTARNNSK